MEASTKGLKNNKMLKSHIVYEDNMDMRTIKCSCGDPDCKIGISFDDHPSIMRLTDKYGNEHAMHLDNKNVKKLISDLKSYIKPTSKKSKR